MPVSVHLVYHRASQHVSHQMITRKIVGASAWVVMLVWCVSLGQAANQFCLCTGALIATGLLLTPVVVGIISCSHCSLVPCQMPLPHGSVQLSKSTAHCHLSWIQEKTSCL